MQIRLERSKLTGLYRCHDISKDDFIESVDSFLKRNRKVKNHLILGDFNVGGSYVHSFSFLSDFLEESFLPLFTGITRQNLRDNRRKEGSCIDNIFVKGENLEMGSYRIEDSFTDHYLLLH